MILAGSTQELTITFYNPDVPENKIDVTNLVIRLLDSQGVQVGIDYEVDEITAKVSTGTYTFPYTFPTGYIGKALLQYQGTANSIDILDTYELEITLAKPLLETTPTITKGTNSYINLAEAEVYATYLLDSTTWDNQSADRKTKALLLACKKIDRQRLNGFKATGTQTLQFPRAMKTDYPYNLYENNNIIYNNDLYIETEVSNKVKEAQFQEALSLLNQNGSNNKRQELRNQGVKSFSLGSLSESYVDGNVSGTQLISQEAKELLGVYISNSFRIN